MTYLGENIKKLGFGMMRLPKVDGEIDIEQTKKMVDEFINGGFTYFDTAFVYPGSEEAVKKALVDRYPREKYQLATKMAAWAGCKSKDDAINQFETSLKRTGAGYFDFYLMHSLGGERTKAYDEYDLWNWALEQKEKGLIRHIGFSFHSTPEDLDEILTNHPQAEFVQLQINYIDWENPSVKSRECYEVARKHNKPVIIMEPVKGGTLANPPKAVKKIMQESEPDSSCASWAVRFAAGLDGVLTVLSGMSSLEQVRDNVSYMKDFKKLNEKQEKVIDEALDIIRKVPIIQCTNCNYCAKVCPKNIGISGSFSAYNVLIQCEDEEKAKKIEKSILTDENKLSASECIKCGKCEEVCPQHISIRMELEKVKKAFENA